VTTNDCGTKGRSCTASTRTVSARCDSGSSSFESARAANPAQLPKSRSGLFEFARAANPAQPACQLPKSRSSFFESARANPTQLATYYRSLSLGPAFSNSPVPRTPPNYLSLGPAPPNHGSPGQLLAPGTKQGGPPSACSSLSSLFVVRLLARRTAGGGTCLEFVALWKFATRNLVVPMSHGF
jgi:hypothetical protein